MTAPNGSELLQRLNQLKRAATKIEEVAAADVRSAMVSALSRDLRKLGELTLTSLPAEEAALLRELYELADHLAEGRFAAQRRKLEQSVKPWAEGPAAPAPFWVRMGVSKVQARTLEEAGLHSLDDVSRLTREEFLSFPGLGRETLLYCEGLLGRPLPSEVLLSASPELPWDREARLDRAQWRSLGFSPRAANALARKGLTIALLSEWSEQELLSLPGFGDITLANVERLLGRRLASESKTFVHWVQLGLGRMAARRLQEEQVHTLEDLRDKSRAELLDLGLGPTALRRLEVWLGPIPSGSAPFTEWEALGLSRRIEKALLRVGLTKPEELAQATREEMLRIPGLGATSLQSIEEATGLTFPSSVLEWRRLGCSQVSAESLSLHRIMTPKDVAHCTPIELLRFGVDWRDLPRLVNRHRGEKK